MKLYLGNAKYKLHLGNTAYVVNDIEEVLTALSLLTSDGYVLTDANGLILTVQEDN